MLDGVGWECMTLYLSLISNNVCGYDEGTRSIVGTRKGEKNDQNKLFTNIYMQIVGKDTPSL